MPSSGHVRIARGTQPPEPAELDERPTRPFGRIAEASPPAARTRPAPLSLSPPASEADERERSTLPGRPPTQPPARLVQRITSRQTTRGATPELPGFGEYLVSSGILSRERLRAAEAYQRSMKVQLSTAIVTLGLATPQRIEWAAVAHRSQLAHDRAAP
jgi:hypothetical protein